MYFQKENLGKTHSQMSTDICKTELKYSVRNYDILLRSTVDAAIQLSIHIFQKEL
jgi:hypothetical protein